MENSGTISLQGSLIRYDQAHGSWELALDRVLLIGEATTDNGPFVDDYWLCFATGPDGWFEASFYAAGRDAFLAAMSARLGAPLNLDLQASADFASRVLWPKPLEGQPMFVYTPKLPANKLMRGVVKLLGGPESNIQTFAPDVERFLNEVAKK